MTPLDELRRRRRLSGELYLEFLRQPALSAGLYEIAAGADDPQTPHHEDEVYIVMSGRAQLRVRDKDRSVETGTVAYVPKEVPHRFHSVVEPLSVVVVFAPAESPDTAPGGVSVPVAEPERSGESPTRAAARIPRRRAPYPSTTARERYVTARKLGG